MSKAMDGDLDFVEVGDVVHEGADVSGVDEAEAGCAAECDDYGVDDAVGAGVRGGEGLVDRGAVVEVGGGRIRGVPALRRVRAGVVRSASRRAAAVRLHWREQ
jgi:hypothetical protein